MMIEKVIMKIVAKHLKSNGGEGGLGGRQPHDDPESDDSIWGLRRAIPRKKCSKRTRHTYGNKLGAPASTLRQKVKTFPHAMFAKVRKRKGYPQKRDRFPHAMAVEVEVWPVAETDLLMTRRLSTKARSITACHGCGSGGRKWKCDLSPKQTC